MALTFQVRLSKMETAMKWNPTENVPPDFEFGYRLVPNDTRAGTRGEDEVAQAPDEDGASIEPKRKHSEISND